MLSVEPDCMSALSLKLVHSLDGDLLRPASGRSGLILGEILGRRAGLTSVEHILFRFLL